MLLELLDLKPRNPYLALALDEALCLQFSRKKDFRGMLRLWSNPYAVILGRTCRPERNLEKKFLNATQITHARRRWKNDVVLCRRASGGGTVLHGPGGINFSLILPLERHPGLYPVQRSYHILLGLVSDALGRLGIAARMAGQSDLVVESGDGLKKVSGNAQFRKHGILVHHGTLIVHRDLIEYIERYLSHPPAEPSYRDGRAHGEFLGHLDCLDIGEFYNSLSGALRRFVGSPQSGPLQEQDRREVFRLARKLGRKIYGDREWILNGKKRNDVEVSPLAV